MGGFGAIAACLDQGRIYGGILSGNSAVGGLHRRLLLETVCLMSTAFDLGPSQIGPQTFGQLLSLLATVVGGAT